MHDIILDKLKQSIIDHWLAFIGLVFTVLVAPVSYDHFITGDKEVIEFLDNLKNWILSNIAETILIKLVVLFVLFYIFKHREIALVFRSTEPEYTERYPRFEDIVSSKIKYGYVEFYPTMFKKEHGAKNPTGAGYDLLHKIFDGKLKPPSSITTWNNMLGELEAKDYDIIATPLYDTKDRRKSAVFTQPIYYADIGIFASKRNITLIKHGIIEDEGLNPPAPGKFNIVIGRLSKLGKKLKLSGYEGELQINMAKKHLKHSTIEKIEDKNFDINSALSGLYEEAEDYVSDILFCDRIQAETSDAYDGGRLFNLLENGELLFPVSYAIRKGEDTLRKFVNLRLMGIEAEKESGISDLLISKTTKVMEPLIDTNIGAQDYFKQAIDDGKKLYSNPSEDSSHNK